jgi:PHD/YefM family antitoxin component YafN of YafNO toxin-antitoxin module
MSNFNEVIQLAEEMEAPVVIYRKNKENLVLTKLSDYWRQRRKEDKNLEQKQKQKSKSNWKEISKKDILKRINKDISLWRKKQKREDRDARVAKLKEELNNNQQEDRTEEEIEEINIDNQQTAPNYIDYSEDSDDQLEEIELEELKSESNTEDDRTQEVPYKKKEMDD